MKTLTVPGELDSLNQIADFVLQAAREAQLNQRRSYFLRLAVDEIATNIILHGYSGQATEGELYIVAKIDEQHLTIYLEDTGANYDPAQALPQSPPKCSPEEGPPGGLGIYLALYGVDQFQYKRVAGRNRSIFRVEHNCKDDILGLRRNR